MRGAGQGRKSEDSRSDWPIKDFGSYPQMNER